ncbi:MAG: RNA polymerase subunit RPABC4/transcription elongation factor Spt4 [Cellvibrionaceae bacterium]|jgi:RNA polymerase subunit RPABC4/transcription elongation factor Spt4
MAVVKCKECGEKVSTKAKTCPSCGNIAPKKTSSFTWVVLILIIIAILSLTNSSSDKKSLSANSSLEVSPPVKNTVVVEKPAKAAPKKPEWEVSTSKDEMTGDVSVYAMSPRAYASPNMSFPYKGMYSWMGVGCKGDSTWVFTGFKSSPNLTKDETKDGYNLIRTRIKWDDSVENIQLTQDWGAKFLHFSSDADIISSIEKSSKAKLELNWHGQQSTYFEYILNGSSKAIGEIRSVCANNK